VVRVNEAVSLAYKPIPFTVETKQSAEIELGQQEILQPGINGLAMTRTRIRFEDGQEVKRVTEPESIVRAPQTKVVNAGTKLVSHGIENMQYWYSIQMYATSYSPCRSGTSGCSYGTASGLRAGYGVVAMSRDWYYALQGMEVYIPGYGRGVIGDLGGGFPDGRAWVDLGYDDNNYQEWSDWVTVYFLGPPPAVIPSVLEPK
jgi:3D (Asp-Asp-Asp) domain-containing protein